MQTQQVAHSSRRACARLVFKFSSIGARDRRVRVSRTKWAAGCRPLSMAALSDRLFEVGDDVVDVLDADRQAHDFGAGARLLQLLGRKLAVGRGSGMNDER